MNRAFIVGYVGRYLFLIGALLLEEISHQIYSIKYTCNWLMVMRGGGLTCYTHETNDKLYFKKIEVCLDIVFLIVFNYF